MNDPHILRAQKVLKEWVQDINTHGMMSLDRPYLKEIALCHLESQMVAECLVDLLAEEFARDAEEKK